MTRKLGGNGRSLAILATLSLAAALACGGTVTGCGSSGGSGSGSGGGTDSGTTGDTGVKPDTGTLDSGQPDTFVVDAKSEPPPQQQLGAPTFTPPGPPPGGASLGQNAPVTINAPAGAPAGTQLFYLAGAAPGSPTPANGSLYNGSPIQITFSGGVQETVNAIAHDPSGVFLDSLVGVAIYNEQLPEAGTLPPVTFSQQSSTQNNDFPLGLSDTPGANICYSLDGVTVPTCTAAGTCISPSLTYNQVLQIDGTVPPNPATGSVTVTAIACEAGSITSASASQTFILQVAQPTMSLAGNAVPPGTGVSNVPWPTGTTGLGPTMQTVTTNSIVHPADTVALWYTFGGTVAPTCTTGNGGIGYVNPTTFGSTPTPPIPVIPPIQNTNQIYEIIGCKTGYLPSTVNTFPITIQLRTPVQIAGGAAAPFNFGFNMSEFTPPNGNAAATGSPSALTDILNFGGGATGGTGGPNGGRDWVCSNNNGAAACGATANTCGAGQFMTRTANGTAQAAGSNPAPIPWATLVAPITFNPTAITTVNSLACALNVNASAVATTAYTLQLPDPLLLSTAALPAAGTSPGWDFAGAGTPPGLPTLAMTLPNGAVTPYGPFIIADVGDTAHLPVPDGCNGKTPGAGGNFACTATANQHAGYYCWIKNAVATCAANGTLAGCNPGAGTNPGGGVAFAAAGAAIPAAVGTATSFVVANDTLSVIACQNAGATPPIAAFFANSPATTVKFSGAGAATAPTVPVQAPTPANQQGVVTITNNDVTAGGSNVCISTNGVAPTCNTAGKCCSAAGGGCNVVGGTETPNVATFCVNTLSATGVYGWNAAGAAGAGCAAVLPLNCGTPGFPACSTQTPASGQAANQVTLDAQTTQPAVQPFAQLDGANIMAVACNASESVSPASSQVYHFTMAQPDFTAAAGGSTVGNLNAGGSAFVGQVIDLSTISNFGTQPFGGSTMSIHYSWVGAATCGSPTSVTPLAKLLPLPPAAPLAAGAEPVAPWFALPTGAQGTAALNPTLCTGNGVPAVQCPPGPAGAPNGAAVPNPGSATSLTLSAIACGENTNGQVSSAVRNATFTITSPQPIIATDQATCTAAQHAGIGGQSCPAASCWTTPGAGINKTTCPPVATWDNIINVNVIVPASPAGANPGTCFTTDGSTVPVCNNTGGCAPGKGTLVNACGVGVTGGNNFGTCANGTAIIPFTFDGTTGASNQHLISGATIQVTSCLAGVTPPTNPSKFQATLATSPAVFNPAAGTLACGFPNPNLTLQQDLSVATQSAGGPTVGEVICYTQNGTSPSYTPACVPTPGAAGAFTICTGTAANTNGTLDTAGVACNCTAAQVTAGICTAAGGNNCPTIGLVASNNPVTWNTCVPGANYSTAAAGEAGTNAYTVPAYTDKITVDGSLSEWDTADTTGAEDVYAGSFLPAYVGATSFAVPNAPVLGSAASSAAGNTAIQPIGFLTYDATNLYLGFAYCGGSVLGATRTPQTACAVTMGVYPPAASSAFGFFIGANPGAAASGATTDLAPLGGNGNALHGIDTTAGIQWAFVYQATGGSAVSGTATWGGPVKGWDNTKTFTVTAAQDAAIWTQEFSIPLSTFGAVLPATLTAYGALFANVSSATSVELFRWPGFNSTVGNPWTENGANPPIGTNAIPGSSPAQFVDFFFEQPTSCVNPVNKFTANPIYNPNQVAFPVTKNPGSPTEF